MSTSLSKIALASQQERIYGSKPDFAGITKDSDNYTSVVIDALNWANAMLDDNDLKQETLDYIKSNKIQIKNVENLDKKCFYIAGRLCWAANNGLDLTDRMIDSINGRIDKIRSQASIYTANAKVADKKPKISRKEINQFKNAEALENLLGDLEGFVDDSINSKKKLKQGDVFKSLNEYDQKAVRAAKKVFSVKFREMVDEINLAKKADVEDFDSKENQNQYLKDCKSIKNAYQVIVSELNAFLGNKAARKNTKPQKSKAARLEKETKDVNYKTTDSEYMVSSIPIQNMVGAQMLVVFNTKNRKLGMYFAKDESGLQINGTTIQNFDTKKSIQKTVRKPDQLLNHLQQANDRRVQIVFEGLSTKHSKCNGRLNDNTLLLKAFKSVAK